MTVKPQTPAVPFDLRVDGAAVALVLPVLPHDARRVFCRLGDGMLRLSYADSQQVDLRPIDIGTLALLRRQGHLPVTEIDGTQPARTYTATLV
jgi:hypothetical protein